MFIPAIVADNKLIICIVGLITIALVILVIYFRCRKKKEVTAEDEALIENKEQDISERDHVTPVKRPTPKPPLFAPDTKPEPKQPIIDVVPSSEHKEHLFNPLPALLVPDRGPGNFTAPVLEPKVIPVNPVTALLEPKMNPVNIMAPVFEPRVSPGNLIAPVLEPKVSTVNLMAPVLDPKGCPPANPVSPALEHTDNPIAPVSELAQIRIPSAKHPPKHGYRPNQDCGTRTGRRCVFSTSKGLRSYEVNEYGMPMPRKK